MPAGGEVLGMRSMVYAFPTFHGAVGEAIGAYGRGLVTVLDPGNDGIARLDAPIG